MFTESSTVEQMILDSVAVQPSKEPVPAHDHMAPGWGESLGRRVAAGPLGATCPPPSSRARAAT